MKYAAGLLILTIILMASGCEVNPDNQDIESPIPVEVLRVVEETRPRKSSFIGTAQPGMTVQLSFKTGGRINEIRVEKGDRVKKGDILASLEKTDLAYAESLAKAQLEMVKAQYEKALNGATSEDIEQARLNVSKAEDTYRYAEEQFEEVERLYLQGTASKQVYDQAKLEHDNNKSEAVEIIENDNNKNEAVKIIEPEKTSAEAEKPSEFETEENSEEDEKPTAQDTANLPDNLGLPACIYLPLNRNLTINPETGSEDSVKWSSSNPDAVSVENGEIIPLAAGESVITANINNAEGKCRVIVSENPNTLVYINDPDSSYEEGTGDPTGNGDWNLPLAVPEHITEINNSDLNVATYIWEFFIDDSFNAELTVPGFGVSYMVHYGAKLKAMRQGGSFDLFGDYKGTLELETKMDDESYLKSLKELAPDFDIHTVKTSFDSKTMDVSFTVETYNLDAFKEARYAYLPENTARIAPLVQIVGMAISEAETPVSADIQIIGDEGGGHAAVSNQPGNVPFVIEIHGDGKATLYLPRLRAAHNRDWFKGYLSKVPVLWLTK